MALPLRLHPRAQRRGAAHSGSARSADKLLGSLRCCKALALTTLLVRARLANLLREWLCSSRLCASSSDKHNLAKLLHDQFKFKKPRQSCAKTQSLQSFHSQTKSR